MKHILIFTHALELGGAERALLGLLENLDYKRYHVDLFLMRHEGELMQYVPEQVNILPEIPQYACLAVPLTNVLKRKKFAIAFGRIIGKIYARYKSVKLHLAKDNGVALEYSHKYTLPFMPQISNTEYDTAISFLTPHYFVVNRVKAKKRIAWIHTDYTNVQIDVNSEKTMWGKYDNIVSISTSVSEGFRKVFPDLAKKLVLVENILPSKLILQQAVGEDVSKEIIDDGSIRLLSIGRYCYAKNFDNIPPICSRILKRGLNVKWYIIGFGNDEELIRKKIVEAKMENYVILLGKKENPYPYIKACDIYIQPSRYEGKSVSVREAQMLGKPVVITRYATAESQLSNNIDGVIVSLDNDKCAEEICDLLCNTSKIKRLSESCLHRDYSGLDAIKEFDKILLEKE